jgi:creatinine amidohydrolase
MLLEEMSWPEIQATLEKTKTVILPVGATEEHGPHLPVFTDTIEAVEVAKEAARRTGVLVAPEIPYGICRSTKGFPGTITIGFDALRLFAHDVLISLNDTGFNKIMVLTGHAGGQHVSALQEACQNVVAERDVLVSLVSLFDLIDNSIVEAPNDGHSGEIETSLMLALRKNLVKGKPQSNYPSRPGFLILRDVRHLMGNGIMGDPSRSSREKGLTFFERAVQGTMKALEEMNKHFSQ